MFHFSLHLPYFNHDRTSLATEEASGAVDADPRANTALCARRAHRATARWVL